jgi:hypothetical protein
MCTIIFGSLFSESPTWREVSWSFNNIGITLGRNVKDGRLKEDR